MKIFVQLVVLAIEALALNGTDPSAQRMTVCQLAARPADFVARKVKVIGAEVSHNGVDISVLVDGSCPGSVVSLMWTTDPRDLNGLTELKTALFQRGEFGTRGKKISGDFFGLIRLDYVGERKVAALVLESVENLRVEFEN